MGLFKNLIGKKPKVLKKLYWDLGYDINSFSQATGVSMATLTKYADTVLEDIPARTANKIKTVING